MLEKRARLIIPGDSQTTLGYCVDHFIKTAREAIQAKGHFHVALSGGSTPKAIFEHLSQKPSALDWTKVHLFWSDERSVPPTSPDSNYRMAMESFKKLPIPAAHIHRMVAEDNIVANAQAYGALIAKHPLDLVLLGIGDDGHTASLFPHTNALHAHHELVVANHVPQHNTWRMTFTYPCINSASHIVVYVLGAGKREILAKAFLEPPGTYPIQAVGTLTHPALWIADVAAASLVEKYRSF